MPTDWKFIKGVVDGESFEIEGINVWMHKWNSTGERIKIQDPAYGQDFLFEVFEIETPSKKIEFAAGEFSNLNWGFYKRISDTAADQNKLPTNKINRRKFIKRTFWGVAGIGLLSGLYAWQIEPFWLEFVRVKMPVKNLPDDLVGKTLMQISDIHIGKRFDHQFIIDSFAEAQKLHPDFVVYTGDYVSTYKDKVQYTELDEVLKNIVTGTLGTVGILGNHDYGKSWLESDVAHTISTRLSESGVKMLRNETTEINGLNFIGFDDFWGMNFNPQQALKNFDSSKANIALCHNPDVCDLDVWGDYNSWILSGHTHGGQAKPPFLPPPLLPVKNRNYSAGQFELSNNRTLYINRALGHLWQIRFNVRPEITVFELQKA